jgi:hypothetical protein
MANFNKDGYVLLKDFLTPSESKKIEKWAWELDSFPEQKGRWMIYYENGDTKSRIENFIDYHPEINDFLNQKITPLLTSVCGERMNIFKDKMNWKTGKAKGFRAHQDQPAWADFPPRRFVSVALFADNTTPENGCLEFVKGKHQEGLFSHHIEDKGQLDEETEKSLDWQFVPTTTRDILIFDSFAPHRSGPNTTDKARRIFYFTYNREAEGSFYYRYIRKKRQEFPPNIEREEGKVYEGKRYNLANPID